MHRLSESNDPERRRSVQTNTGQDLERLYPRPPSHFNSAGPGPTSSSQVNAVHELGLTSHVLGMSANHDRMMSSASMTMSEMPPSGLDDDFMFLEDFLLPTVSNIIPNYFAPLSLDVRARCQSWHVERLVRADRSDQNKL